ncbi:hypothetical protein MRX96_030540 [Rhipicephalus microplus]
MCYSLISRDATSLSPETSHTAATPWPLPFSSHEVIEGGRASGLPPCNEGSPAIGGHLDQPRTTKTMRPPTSPPCGHGVKRPAGERSDRICGVIMVAPQVRYGACGPFLQLFDAELLPCATKEQGRRVIHGLPLRAHRLIRVEQPRRNALERTLLLPLVYRLAFGDYRAMNWAVVSLRRLVCG